MVNSGTASREYRESGGTGPTCARRADCPTMSGIPVAGPPQKRGAGQRWVLSSVPGRAESAFQGVYYRLHCLLDSNRRTAVTASPEPDRNPRPIDSDSRNRTVGRLFVLGAAILWSSSGLFAKATFFDDWPLEQRGLLFAFWRAFAAAVVLGPAVRGVRWQILLVPMVLCFAGMNITYLLAMTQSTAANAIWLQSTAPFWVLIYSVYLFKEKVVRRDLVPLAFAFVGIGVILGCEFSRIDNPSQVGVLCGLASGMLYGGVVVCLRQLRRENSAWLVALNHLAAALVLIPCVLWFRLWPSPLQLVWLAAFGALQMAVPYLLLVQGLKRISSQEAVVIGLLEPVLVPAWALLFWGEMAAWWTFVGAGLILVGLILRYVVWGIAFPPQNRAPVPRVPPDAAVTPTDLPAEPHTPTSQNEQDR